MQHKTFGRLSYLSTEDSREDARTGRHTFTKVASCKGSLVAVKLIKKRQCEITRAVKKELYLMREMGHDNVNRFVGACVDPPGICIVTQYCARGSLKVGSHWGQVISTPPPRLLQAITPHTLTSMHAFISFYSC